MSIVIVCHISELSLRGIDLPPVRSSARAHGPGYRVYPPRGFPTDVIYLNEPTELQFAHYLCEQKPVVPDRSVAGFESFWCNGFQMVSSDAVKPETFSYKWQEMARVYDLKPGTRVGWLKQDGPADFRMLRDRFPEFSGLKVRSFGHYIEISAYMSDS